MPAAPTPPLPANWVPTSSFTNTDQNTLEARVNSAWAAIAAGPDANSISVSQLSATGTKSAATVLYGNNTFAAPPTADATVAGRALAIAIALA